MDKRSPKTQGAEPETRLWLLNPSEVREQLLLVAIGSKQIAVPTGSVDAVDERGRIHAVPRMNPLFLGAVTHAGRLLPLVSGDQLHTSRQAARDAEHVLALDPDLLAGPFLLVVRHGEELMGLGFERFIGFHSPARYAEPPAPGTPKWVKATGTIDEIPVFVVDTAGLFEYCKARSS